MAYTYSNYDVFKNEELELQSWFWLDATRPSAEEALQGQQMGYFLVRPCSQQNAMALSHVMKGGNVGHALIYKKGDVVTLEDADREFSSIEQLVGLLSLVPAPLSPKQREALDKRRRDHALLKTQSKAQAEQRLLEAGRMRDEEQRVREQLKKKQVEERDRIRKQEEEEQGRRRREKKVLLARMQHVTAQGESRARALMDANRFTGEEIEGFRGAFQFFDPDHEGGFTASDLQLVANQFGIALSPADLSQIMRDLDADGNGLVTLSEFLDAYDRGGDELLTDGSALRATQ